MVKCDFSRETNIARSMSSAGSPRAVYGRNPGWDDDIAAVKDTRCRNTQHPNADTSHRLLRDTRWRQPNVGSIQDRGGSDLIGSKPVTAWRSHTWGVIGQIIICNQVADYTTLTRSLRGANQTQNCLVCGQYKRVKALAFSVVTKWKRKY